MPTDPSRIRRLVVVLGSAAVVAAGIAIARSTAAESDSGPRAGSAPLPPAVAGRDPAPSSGSSDASVDPPSSSAAHRHPVTRPGVPVELVIRIPTPNHPQGIRARVIANKLNPDGTLHVPADPRTVSWAKDDAEPGAGRGTTILTSHINYVINGQLVIGALSDLALYAKQAVGKTISLRLRDGRVLRYRVVAGREYTKDQLGGDPKLRAELYDQKKVYGPAAKPSGRLLLVSCGGAFDPYSGEYQDNVFLYALPEF